MHRTASVIEVSSTMYFLEFGNPRPEDLVISSQRSNRSKAIHALPILTENSLLGHSLLDERVYGRIRRGDHFNVCEITGKTWALSTRDRLQEILENGATHRPTFLENWRCTPSS